MQSLQRFPTVMVKCAYLQYLKIYCATRENKISFFLNKKDMNHNDVYRFGKGLHRIWLLPKPFEISMKCV